jgi:dihydropteroate synthase
MQVDPQYAELVSDIRGFLAQAVASAERQGIARDRLVVDPGIGFGKTSDHNLQLIKRLQEFAALDLPIVVGPSRKAFIRRLLKPDEAKDISPLLPEVETGTQAAVAAAVLNGAHIVRVHDVARTVTTVKVIDAILNA